VASQPDLRTASDVRPEVVVLLTTLPSGADGDAFATTLVDERLAACVSVSPEMLSVYRWMGAIERATERQVLVKTTRDQVPRIKARLATLHPYEVPEVLVLSASDGSEAYLAWVRQATGS
jgi:periplasmic divalent cation tolerance protein